MSLRTPSAAASASRVLGPCAALLLAACMMTGPSRVAQGQLYVAGSGNYDPYFRDVHQQQVEAAAWGEGKRTSHRALVQALSLTPDAPDVTIVQATHEAASKSTKQQGSLRLDVDGTNARVVGTSLDGSLSRAIEDTSRSELERAKKLHVIESRLASLTKTGNELQARAHDDWAKRGSGKESEVTNELRASLDVLGDLKARADSEARESEDFVADLERALETASEDRYAKREKRDKRDKGDKRDRGDKPERKEPKAVAEAKPDAPAPPPKPATPPPPKPADNGEVFNP
jgi:hypothetical protein